MDLDLKSLVLCSAIGLAAGGSLYGFYVKHFGEAGMVQGQTHGLVSECAILLNSHSSAEVEEFLIRVKEKQSEIDKSDTVTTSVSLAMDEKRDLPAGMGQALALCASDLESLKASEKS